jgi:AIPR protein.
MGEDLTGYAHWLIDEVRTQAESAGCDLRDAFTELVLDQFCAEGYAEETHQVYFRDHGVEVSGWGVWSDQRCLDLFLVYYSPRADEEHRIDRAGAEAAFRRLENFLTRCVTGRTGRWDASDEFVGMCRGVAEHFANVSKVRLVVVTNARSVLRERLEPITVEGRRVERDLWDLRRLASWAVSGSRAEPIVAEFPDGLAFLDAPRSPDGDHRVILTVVPGRHLADLYAIHGARLLELNVRSFLQVRGSVNKGILETLRTCPQRFLAYNNGVAATASGIDVEQRDGQWVITRIHDLQIVNGGQTTATLHHAQRNAVDISAAHVQMKLTIVDPSMLDDIVPQISAYSNTQNRVSRSDLKANSSFHVDVERIMKAMWAPPTAEHPYDTHWFYERARGQYATALARETPARRKHFRTVNPPAQKITKAELAKYEHSWAMLPHVVSLGSEKNFILFSERLEDQPIAVDRDFCRRLVAKAILFRRADRIVAQHNFGGYKANIVTYTVAKLVHSTGGRIDLERIWRDQGLSPALEQALSELAVLVHKVITNPPAGRSNISEWAKRPECWHAVRDLAWTVPERLQAELIDTDAETYGADLERVRRTRPADWSDLIVWGERTGALTAGQRQAAAEIAQALSHGWNPAGRMLRVGVAAMRHATNHGFRNVAGFEGESESASRVTT